MIVTTYSCRFVAVALLLAGSAMPTIVTAHSEGVEAADPNTPPAVLTFDAAARGYMALRNAPVDWRSRLSNDAPPMADHAGHASHAGHGSVAEPASPHHHQQ